MVLLGLSLTMAGCTCPGKQGKPSTTKPGDEEPTGPRAGNPPANPAFVLDLQYLKDEQSKDSSTATYKILVRDHHARFSHTHRGAPEDETNNKTYRLTDPALQNLKAFIKQHKLNTDLTENKPATGTGVSIKLQLSITLEGQTTRLEIRGQLYAWDARLGRAKTNLEHKHTVDIVTRIVSMIENHNAVL